MNSLLTAIQMQDEEIAFLGFAALDETVFVGYEYLAKYLQQIGEVTTNIMATDNYSLQNEALKFWTDIAKTEAARTERKEPVFYIAAFGPSLIEIALQGLKSSQLTED